MAVNSRRFRIILIVCVCVVLLGLVLGWAIVVPKVIEAKANDALAQVKEKTGRTVAISGIRLSGLKSLSVGHTTLSDVNQPEKTGVTLDDVKVTLSSLPFGDFSISSIQIDDIHVHVRLDEGKTNFDDVIEALKPKEKKEPTEPKKTPKWKQYLTPFPRVEIGSLAVTMPEIKVNDVLEVGAVSASHLLLKSSDNEELPYDVSGNFEMLLVESGKPSTYVSRVSGQIKDGKNGYVKLTQPVSDDKQIPDIFKLNGSQIAFENVEFKLPTTFVLNGLDITQGNKSLIKADSARAQLMTLPPRKVSGVYLKEVELIKPEIHDYIREEGSVIFQWARSYAEMLAKAWGTTIDTKVDSAVKDVAAEAAGAAIQAGIKAAVENSENPGEDIAKAVIEKVKPKTQKNPKDYFFSQRMFITDGTFIVDDQRIDTAQAAIDKINLEVGYRGIRKVVDYHVGFHAFEPFLGDVSLLGQYDLPGEKLNGKLTITPMRTASEFKNFQANLQKEKKEKPEDAGILAKFIPSMDLSKTVFEASLAFDADFKKKNLDLTSRLSVKDFVWHLEALSKDPTNFSGSLAVTLGANWDKMALNLKAIELESEGAKLGLSAKFNKEQRKLKTKNNNGPMVDAWHFDLMAQLPDQRMNDLFEAIPHALRNELDGLAWRGTLGLKFEASGFLDALSETQHKLSLITSEDFAVTEWPVGRNINALNNGFKYTVQDPNALKEHVIVIPPSIYPVYQGDYPIYNPRMSADEIRLNYRDWVLFDDLNPWLVQLITTTEDGSFFSHSGFSPLQIKAALEKNVNKQAFSRGASTISMQLVKNIFFDRTKTISRKFQEFIYTWLMESVVRIPKKRIMELYFNIIEFGPEIYGIEEAAKYYFGKRSKALSLKECAFLMAIIPNPRNGANYRTKTILDNWLQKTMTFYMSEMYRRKCDPTVLARMKERSLKEGKEPTFVPCCPPRDSLQLMMNSETLDFYMPDPLDPLKYGYRPDEYTPDGTPLTPLRENNCGMIDAENEMEAEQEAESIFGTFVPDMNEN